MTDHPTAPPDTMPYDCAADLSAVRAFASARALAGGLPAARVDLLALVVSELTTNTLQHTDGGGSVRVWVEAGQLCCDVVDRGGPRPTAGRMPPADAVRGRGLAIVAAFCDEVDVRPGPAGTVVRVRFDL
ncbi:ATP-binding protein [Micromonospora sp. AP08]|uniref:ATP-binding protein n=1 Tax=Micromonospora sp. AP08 TaxID=2604467 RepID=UPI002107D7ED|nr:ATP-binding protein [Micromonospora sp. AP08]